MEHATQSPSMNQPTATVDPTVGTQAIARTPDYNQAQRLVDQLSDSGFPVEHVTIVGRGLHSIEIVTGRLTKAKAAMQGAAGGAWFGLLIGLLMSLFVVGIWWSMLLGGLIIGAVFGAVFAFAAHWSTRGRRDFSSVQTMSADEYEVLVDESHAADATSVIGRI